MVYNQHEQRILTSKLVVNHLQPLNDAGFVLLEVLLGLWSKVNNINYSTANALNIQDHIVHDCVLHFCPN
jgi:hypothetical protein